VFQQEALVDRSIEKITLTRREARSVDDRYLSGWTGEPDTYRPMQAVLMIPGGGGCCRPSSSAGPGCSPCRSVPRVPLRPLTPVRCCLGGRGG
jgi:hypothetical protein